VEGNITRLTKVWRQSDPAFLDALNHARRGDGTLAAASLRDCGVDFQTAADIRYKGTTIVARNDEVDRFNFSAQQLLATDAHIVKSERRGKQTGEWKNIPDQNKFKIDDYVMILNNDSPQFTYVNGDCGWVREFNGHEFVIELKRNGRRVAIGPIVRYLEQKDEPEGWLRNEAEKNGLTPYLRDTTPRIKDEKEKVYKWVLGELHYYPLRLGYAITCHKSQGLSLDAVQIDIRNAFFGQPHMLYVALSRARTVEGLRIVGSREMLAQRCKIDPKVERWL
jgi:ATP-dependent DNA helicase PIF1